jgi:hypothetical protein
MHDKQGINKSTVIKGNRMNSRRDFFRKFIGQVGVFSEEMRGVEHVPLLRLRELPDEIMEEIVPVYFPGLTTTLANGCLLVYDEGGGMKMIDLTSDEYAAFRCFDHDLNLKTIAVTFATQDNIPAEIAMSHVRSAFIKLAEKQVCHPRDSQPIVDFLQKKKNRG